MEDRELVRATPAARALAERMGVDLNNVMGSGYKGRIHKDDVANWNFEAKVHISPLAKSIAEYHNLDISSLKGSGHNNKIMKDDVVKLITDPALKAALTGVAVKDNKTVENTAKASAAPASVAASGDTEVVPLTMMRKIIAKRMSESYFSIPSFIVTVEFDMTEILALRKNVMDAILEKTGKKATVTDFISLAVIRTLMKHKAINASLNKEGTEIIYHNYVNLAIAVGMDEGLLVPVVKNADKMSLSELVVAMKDITSRTMSKKLLPDEQTGSTFTISNLGMYGVDQFTAIINQPNAAILSVSSAKKQAVVIGDEIKIRPMMKMSITCDHRIIDGLAAAKFMSDLKALIENPLSLLI